MFLSCDFKIQQLFERPFACLTSTLLETGVSANNCKCSQDQQFNMPSEERKYLKKNNMLYRFFFIAAYLQLYF
jgi:hypothetical protein